MKIFIGHDSRYESATKVCEKSILNYNPKADITFLDKSKMISSGIYGRKDIPGESTEFSFTRFYVPLLAGYEGKALFCDNDFLWKCDISEIEKYVGNEYPLAVVKHDDYTVIGNKMNGIQNKSYPRKNWSSLMIFDCAYFKDILTKDYLDKASASELHELRFIHSDKINDIPKEYNCLVGHYAPEGAKALHYTNGGPWFEDYRDAELSWEWWNIYESL